MNSPAELFRLAETWNWRMAIYAYDYAYFKPLAELIRSEPIPPEYIDVVIDAIVGERKPNRKAASKLKIPIEKRIKYATGIGLLRATHGLRLKSENVQSTTDRVGNQTAADIRQLYQDQKRSDMEDLAKALDVSYRNVKDFMREIEELIDSWPEI